MLDPAEGSEASARLTPVILPVGARAHRNLTFLSQREEASYNRPLLHMTVGAEDAAVTIQRRFQRVIVEFDCLLTHVCLSVCLDVVAHMRLPAG